MENIQINIASQSDYKDLDLLLNNFDLPDTQIMKEHPKYWIAKSDQIVIGSIGLDVHDKNAVLCSFAVDSNYQNAGVGEKLYQRAINQATVDGITSLYLLTTTASDYFFKRNWTFINRNSVPEEIAESEEFKSICPQSASCMYYPVNDLRMHNALHTFRSNFNCAQSVLVPWANELNIDEKTALKLATGFGGGIASKGETCGTVTGAYMAIGLKYGKSELGDDVSKANTLNKIAEFDEQFISRFGSLKCKDLLKADISNPADKEKLVNQGDFDKVCPGFVMGVTEILDKILHEDE